MIRSDLAVCLGKMGRVCAFAAVGIFLSITVELPAQNGAIAQTTTGQSAIIEENQDAPMTQLEQRLSPLENRRRMEAVGNILLSDQYWLERADIIAGSDPLEDAQKDVEDGILGFMTEANIGWGGRPYAPGIRCSDRRLVKNYAIFTDSHGDALSAPEWEASKAYRAYAKAYNQSRFVAELREETGCEIDVR